MLEDRIAKTVASAFKGQLLTGTLRREAPGGIDANGDPLPSTVTTYSFDGMLDSYSLFYRSQAGIPDGDMKVLVIAGSLDVTPKQGDQVKLRNQWFSAVAVETDPAQATWELQAHPISDPTA